MCGRRSVRARTCVSGKCGWVCVCVLGGGTDDPDHACLGLGLIERVEILAQCADDRLIPAPSSINRGRTLHVPIDRSARTSHQPQRPVVTRCALYILRCTLCAAKACRVSDRYSAVRQTVAHCGYYSAVPTTAVILGEVHELCLCEPHCRYAVADRCAHTHLRRIPYGKRVPCDRRAPHVAPMIDCTTERRCLPAAVPACRSART